LKVLKLEDGMRTFQIRTSLYLAQAQEGAVKVAKKLEIKAEYIR